MKYTLKLILLWLIDLALIGGSFSAVYLVINEVELTIKTHQESYLTARARADLINWHEVLEASADDRALIAGLFVGRDSLVDFIERLEAVARESQVELKLGEPTIEAKALKLTLQMQGSFSNLHRLLVRLENLPYHIVLGQIDLTGDTEWQGQVVLSLLSFDDDHV